MSLRTSIALIALFAGALTWGVSSVKAQVQLQIDSVTGDEGMVQLNFPTDVELKTLIDYVSERLNVNILYDEQIAGKKVSIKAPAEIPASSLLNLLESALRMGGFVLVDTEPPGWKRVVQSGRLGEVARTQDPQQAIEESGTATPVTQAFVLQHADPQQLTQVITPFLTQPGANVAALPEQRVLIVTDYASNVLKLSRLIEMIDRPKAEIATDFVPVRHTQASILAQQLNQLLAARLKAVGTAPGRAVPTVEVASDDRTNQLIVVGPKTEVDEVLGYINTLDVPLGLDTKVYPVGSVSAERIDRLVRELLNPADADRLYRSAIDREDNLLIATATPEIHQRIQTLVERLDVPAEQASRRRSPVRFYKLKNVTVAEVLETLRNLQGGTPEADEPRPLPSDGRIRPLIEEAVPGPNRPPRPPREMLPTPPSYREPPPEDRSRRESQAVVTPVSFQLAGAEPLPSLVPGGAQVTGDPNTNTIIIVGEPNVQRVYEELIEMLDRPRPQVLIEAKVVVIDTSDNFTLGVEISAGDREGDERLFAFSSFGLSDVDPVTGALAIIPGLGFNGTLVDPDVADVVLRALSTHRRARILSAPRVLVNDNATGMLTSVAEVPFTSVNASDTVATTSFAGFAEAGTTIIVTPHISENDHLQLEYTVTLNSFTGTGVEGIPPPRQTDEVQSEVTIPDGHTIIVGGLNRSMHTQDIETIPFIEDVPLLRELAKLENKSRQCSSLFVFLRPVILRDDKFRDLKFLSEVDVHRAVVHPDYPKSEPVILK